LDDARMSDQFEYVDFARNPLHVRHVHYLLLVQNFDRYFLACRDMDR
jgi:hypothetical protein